MIRTHTPRRAVAAMTLAAMLSFAPVAPAQRGGPFADEPIVIRSTIPDPRAVKRTPLTSDQLSTTSTRLIDARRGFRPFDSVHGDAIGFAFGRQYRVGADDHFGISRAENRPFSYSQRAPRTSVTRFENVPRMDRSVPVNQALREPRLLILRTELMTEPTPPSDATKASRIRIHRDTSAVPSDGGAVLITSDGTVIQIGD